MLILPERELWTPERRELWTPETPAGRTRRRGGFIAPDRGVRWTPLYATIGRTFIGFIASGTNATSYLLTMSAQPTVGRLELVAVVNTVASGTAPVPSSVSGNALTYTLIDGTTFSSGSIGVRITVWRALGITSGAGQITVSFGATQTSCVAVANEFDGIDTSGTNGSGAIVQSVPNANGGASHTAGTFTTSLAAFGNAANRPYVALTDMVNASDWTALTNWTSIGVGFQGSPANNCATHWRSDAADTTAGATHATTSNVALVALEIAAAATGAAIMRRTLSNIGTRTGARQGI